MSDSVFRYRGLKVVVDTTEKAEFDAKSLRLGDKTMERIGRELAETSFSPRDRVVGDVRVREIEGYDVAFVNGREDSRLVITIGRIERPDPDNPLEEVLKKLGPLAILRGASGV
ncbi:hypothetical protein [Roseovarius indicus]|uniref:hypothetical protein n=1 Tax=Roseovarius indicus TaxID=540747 RepID=UPI0007D9A116|nr:hypothetical protein [Roseovarius indicus]OAO07564.1 hypothetical protein A8B76_17670 [Roseovarius indicus]